MDIISGETSTDRALDMPRDVVYFQDRPYAPNIAILVTDGLSTSPNLTVDSAQQVKDAQITVFAIG